MWGGCGGEGRRGSKMNVGVTNDRVKISGGIEGNACRIGEEGG